MDGNRPNQELLHSMGKKGNKEKILMIVNKWMVSSRKSVMKVILMSKVQNKQSKCGSRKNGPHKESFDNLFT